MKEYSSIFNTYSTSENIPFLMLNKRIHFPEDKNLFIYDKKVVTENTPWTLMSYKLYKTIDYWWVLNLLNPGNFYAEEGNEIFYIKKDYLDDILTAISTI